MSIIVVTARVVSGGGLPASTTYVTTTDSQVQQAYGGEFYPEGQTGIEIQVNVQVTNPANQAQAEEAARNIADAIAKIVKAASALPPSTAIPLPGGQSITVGELLDLAKTTKFVISDVNPFANGGVGGADAGTLTVTMYAPAFAAPTPGYPNSYADPNYLNGQGLVGAVLHELAHMTIGGVDAAAREHFWHNYERTNHLEATYDFNQSDYWRDNEAFAVSSATAMGSGINIDVSQYTGSMAQYSVHGDGSYLSGSTLYQEHRDLYGWIK
jgi:hypothetical protein